MGKWCCVALGRGWGPPKKGLGAAWGGVGGPIGKGCCVTVGRGWGPRGEGLGAT